MEQLHTKAGESGGRESGGKAHEGRHSPWPSHGWEMEEGEEEEREGESVTMVVPQKEKQEELVRWPVALQFVLLMELRQLFWRSACAT